MFQLILYIKNLFVDPAEDHIIYYPTPKNLSYNWSFGSLSGVFFFIQILTGFFLSMHYIPKIDFAFSSFENITRDVNFVWLIHYLHLLGAYFFFFVVFFHIFRNLYFGSYIIPKRDLWVCGILMFFLVMAITFTGFVLPWSSTSFWGTALTYFFSAVTVHGTAIVNWLYSCFSADQDTLNRFYSAHFLLPIFLYLFISAHIELVDESESKDPLGLGSNNLHVYPSTIPYFPSFYVRDRVFDFCADLALFIIFFGPVAIFFFFFFAPQALIYATHYIDTDPAVVPVPVVPKWYFLPFYAMLRCSTNKFYGLAAMIFSILGLLILLLTSNIHKYPVNGFFLFLIFLFIVNFFFLGWLAKKRFILLFAPFCTILYFLLLFLFFFIPYISDTYYIKEKK